jgi:hypothetical protein
MTTQVFEESRLLAARARGPSVIARPNHNGCILSTCDNSMQIDRDGRESAAMARGFLAVHPDRGVVIDGLEVQQHSPIAPFLWDFDDLAIPDRRHEIDVTDAG